MITIGNGKEIVRPQKFPDGTMRLNLSNIYYEQTEIQWAYDNDEEMVVLFYLVNHLRANVPDIKLTLSLPYLPNARMDRVHDKKTEVFTLKHFASFINSLNFFAVRVLDVHSDVAAALINHIDIEMPTRYIDRVVDKIKEKHSFNQLLLFYPDEGAMKRYSKLTNHPYAFGVKQREWETGNIIGLDVINGDSVKDKAILIIDDICSKGKTFYYSAKRLMELGARNIYLYITHCENSVLDGEMIESDLIQRIYTTDTIFTAQHPKIEVFKRFR